MPNERSPIETPSASHSNERYAVGDFEIDLASYELRRSGEVISVSSKAFDALVHLIRNRDRVVSKDELLSAIWPDAVVSEDSLVQCISALRKAFGDDREQQRVISTISRRGYRFLAPVTPVGQAAPPDLISENPVRSTTVPPAPESAAAHSNVTAGVIASTGTRFRHARWWGIALAVFFLGWILGASTQRTARGTRGEDRVLSFTQDGLPGTRLASGGVLSPDGLHIALALEDSRTGKTQLWLRDLNNGDARVLSGTDGASRPFWSPNSENIGYFANGWLRTIGIHSSGATDIAQARLPAGGSWGADDRIVFANWATGLFSVRATGGPAQLLREPDLSGDEASYAWPYFLPDGQHLLYSVVSRNPEVGGVYVGSVLAKQRSRLVQGGNISAVYAAPGYLLYSAQTALMAQPFDASNLVLKGQPVRIAGGVVGPDMPNGTSISASTTGLLSFGGATGEVALTWFDRHGLRLDTISTPISLHNPQLALNDTLVLACSWDAGQMGLWVVNLERGGVSWRIADSTNGALSPEGTRVAVAAGRQQQRSARLYVKSLVGKDQEEEALEFGTQPPTLNYWSREPRYLVGEITGPQRNKDLWLYPQFGDRKPRAFLETPFNKIQAQVSPDGRWIAYASDESGAWEVYVQSFPIGGAKQAISVNGGAEPQWRSDGGELFYLAADHSLVAVPIKSGNTLTVGRSTALFRLSIAGGLNTYRNHYTVSQDGQRFLVDNENTRPITTMLNWERLVKPSTTD